MQYIKRKGCIMYTRTKTFYRICPDCGASLDPGESCDCHEERGVKYDDRGSKGSTKRLQKTLGGRKSRSCKGVSIEILAAES